MVASLTYRTTDGTRWGGGQGSNLSATQIDINFWTLFSAVQVLEDNFRVGAGIDYITQPVGGNTFFVHLTDHRVLGPFVLPAAQWNPRQAWRPTTTYAAFDVVSNNGQLYLVAVAHTSASTFSPFATDGMGHLLYVLILEAPSNALPVDGIPGQRLVKSTSSPYTTEWATDFVRLVLYIDGQPNPSETLMQFAVVDNMLLPRGLLGSSIFQQTGTITSVEYDLFHNGNPIGSVTFDGPSPESISVSFPSDVECIPGDVLTIVAPATPDTVQANISFTLVAHLTL